MISQASSLKIPFAALSALLALLALKRYGPLVVISTLFFFHLSIFYPITTNLSAWYAIDFTIALIICLTLLFTVSTPRSAGNRCLARSFCRKIEKGQPYWNSRNRILRGTIPEATLYNGFHRKYPRSSLQLIFLRNLVTTRVVRSVVALSLCGL